MKAKNAKVGTRVQVKDCCAFGGDIGTILGDSETIFHVQVGLDNGYEAAFDYDELRQVK